MWRHIFKTLSNNGEVSIGLNYQLIAGNSIRVKGNSGDMVTMLKGLR